MKISPFRSETLTQTHTNIHVKCATHTCSDACPISTYIIHTNTNIAHGLISCRCRCWYEERSKNITTWKNIKTWCMNVFTSAFAVSTAAGSSKKAWLCVMWTWKHMRQYRNVFGFFSEIRNVLMCSRMIKKNFSESFSEGEKTNFLMKFSFFH